MAGEIFFENQTVDGDSAILKQTGIDGFDDSEFLIKVTGNLGGGTITLQYDFSDGDFAPLLDNDGSTSKTITSVGIVEGGANVTAKRI
jgi:hypothetical protein